MNISLHYIDFLGPYFFQGDLLDRRTLAADDKLIPQLENLNKHGVAIYIQRKSFDGTPFTKHVVVWRRADWEMEYEKHRTEKWDSERRCQEHMAVAVEIGKIELMLVGRGLGAIAKSTAEGIYNTRNIPLANLMGLDVSEILWKEDVEKKVHELLPELKKENIF